ncbi:glycosyltransferase [Altererythrobacter sp. Z27]|uniref:glycosyltransferase n=1 Tax=Altererythrobacter sp. Z27 TaxID=3461147 RepID=UPI00404476B6
MQQAATKPASPGAVTSALPFSVIIPAHDEAAVIGRCLSAIFDTAPPSAEVDLVVAANGCSDRTVELAREAAPQARVIEIAQASKTAAINAAQAHCRYFPRLVVDADIVCDYASLAATAEALREPGIMAASPSVRVALDDASAWVRAYYRTWLRLPYVTDKLVGGGVYGLSETGLRRIGELPSVVADDLYVRTRFAPCERANVTEDGRGRPVFTTIIPPRNWFTLLRIEARRLRGKRQIDTDFPTAHSGTINGISVLMAAARQGAGIGNIAIYIATKLLARLLHALGSAAGRKGWSRDMSSRS